MISFSFSVFTAGASLGRVALEEVNSESGAEKSSKIISMGITSTSGSAAFGLSFRTGLAMPLGSGFMEMGSTSSVSASWDAVAFAVEVPAFSALFRLASAYALAMNAAARAKTAASFCCEAVVSVAFSSCGVSAGSASFSSVTSTAVSTASFVVPASFVASAGAGTSSVSSTVMLSSEILAVSSEGSDVVSEFTGSSAGTSVSSDSVWASSSVSFGASSTAATSVTSGCCSAVSVESAVVSALLPASSLVFSSVLSSVRSVSKLGVSSVTCAISAVSVARSVSFTGSAAGSSEGCAAPSEFSFAVVSVVSCSLSVWTFSSFSVSASIFASLAASAATAACAAWRFEGLAGFSFFSCRSFFAGFSAITAFAGF